MRDVLLLYILCERLLPFLSLPRDRFRYGVVKKLLLAANDESRPAVDKQGAERIAYQRLFHHTPFRQISYSPALPQKFPCSVNNCLYKTTKTTHKTKTVLVLRL